MADADRLLVNHLRVLRQGRGWSQAQLADRAGLSRSGVSAVEQGSLAPSTAAALALARALEVPVEKLFELAESGRSAAPEWAWAPPMADAPHWRACVGTRTLRYPVERTLIGAIAHDRDDVAPPTLVLAGCDPAVGLLAAALQRHTGHRLLPLSRASGAALDLLRTGHVHLAGIHLGDNAAAARAALGPGHALIRVASWQEGLAVQPGLGLGSVRDAVRGNFRWVARQPGSGARQCMDRVLADAPRRPRGLRRIAADHLGVAATIDSGWAQVGVCVRMAASQAGLDFLPIQTESFDLCTRIEHLDEPGIHAVVQALRSAFFRRQAACVPGYDVSAAGDVQVIR